MKHSHIHTNLNRFASPKYGTYALCNSTLIQEVRISPMLMYASQALCFTPNVQSWGGPTGGYGKLVRIYLPWKMEQCAWAHSNCP